MFFGVFSFNTLPKYSFFIINIAQNNSNL
jgi:hypothetical protein